MTLTIPRLRQLALPFALTLGVAACGVGGGGGGGAGADSTASEADTLDAPDGTIGGDDDTSATAAPDDTSTPDDTAPPADTTPPVVEQPGTPVYGAECTIRGFTPSEQTLVVDGGVSAYDGALAHGAKSDHLAIEIYTGGDYTGATAPGRYSLAGSNYDTCSNCVLVRAGCEGGRCEKVYYADEGELVITQWSPETGFTGFLDGVVLKEVTIDSAYHSTPVAGGGVICLDQYAFDAEMPRPVVGGENTQPTCVAEGTGYLVGDNVADYSLKNCLGETVSLHSRCGESKALWLIGVAGWCQPCTEELNSIASQVGGTITREALNENMPGLEAFVLLGEDVYGEVPTTTYCKSYAQSRHVDPALVLIDNASKGADIPLISPAGYSVELTAFGNTYKRVNPYLRAAADGTVTTSTPWNALLRGSNMEYIWSDNAQTGETLEQAMSRLLSE